jgi:hypothetical protein
MADGSRRDGQSRCRFCKTHVMQDGIKRSKGLQRRQAAARHNCIPAQGYRRRKPYHDYRGAVSGHDTLATGDLAIYPAMAAAL